MALFISDSLDVIKDGENTLLIEVYASKVTP